MRIIVVTLASLLLLIAAPVTAQDFDRGLAAYNAGDYATAIKEWKPLAEDGNSIAQLNRGVMYYIGQGVPQDYKKAAKWYTLAAEQDYADAQANLGAMYYNGEGVLADFVITHMWFSIAAANGIEIGAENREIIAKEMTLEDISKAQTMARECINSNYQNCGH